MRLPPVTLNDHELNISFQRNYKLYSKSINSTSHFSVIYETAFKIISLCGVKTNYPKIFGKK